MSGLAGALASLAVAAGALVLVSGVVRAALAPAQAAARFARAVPLALEFLLAAGLLRLGEAMTAETLGTAVAIIFVRRFIAAGLRPLARG